MKTASILQKVSPVVTNDVVPGKTVQNPLQPQTTSLGGMQNPLQQKKNNETGLPDKLKAGVEALSGYSMDDVRVHYNSDNPAQLQAHAYAQGSDIHVAPGQEEHLPHEAWHVVQQKQGRVKATMQMKDGQAISDDIGLEKEADYMGENAWAINSISAKKVSNSSEYSAVFEHSTPVIQLKKTKIPDLKSSEEEINNIITNLRSEIKQNIAGPLRNLNSHEQAIAIWTEAKRVYDVNEEKGEKYMNDLAHAINKYKNDIQVDGESPKENLIKKNKDKRTGYTTKFQQNYITGSINVEDDIYEVRTQGHDGATPPQFDAHEHKDYTSSIELAKNAITVEQAWASEINPSDWKRKQPYIDKAYEAKKGLPHSEILWQQYRLAAEEKYKEDADKTEKVKKALRDLNQIGTGMSVNHETIVTLIMARDDGDDFSIDDDKTWYPTDNEFKAVLATPNAKNSYFILLDHLDELGKTFELITSTSAGGLEIKFKSIR